jgi:hypothetical protein
VNASVPPVRVTVKVKTVVPALPSAWVTSEIVTDGGGPSSLTIVPVAEASASVAPAALESVTVKPSSASGLESASRSR